MHPHMDQLGKHLGKHPHLRDPGYRVLTLHYNPTLLRHLRVQRRRGQVAVWLPWGRVLILTWRQW